MVTKAIIPVAGFGTRFLPATKSVPKEMFPIVDKPILQILVEQLNEAGIKDILFILPSAGKECIKDHFLKIDRLDKELIRANKLECLNQIKEVEGLARFHFVVDKDPKGMLQSMFYGKDFIKNEPFLMLVGDGFIHNKQSSFKQMIDAYNKVQSSIIAVKSVKKEEVYKYGIVKPENNGRLTKIDYFVEKPKVSEAPSRLASIGQYLFDSEFMEMFKQIYKETNNFPDIPTIVTEMAKHKKPAHMLNINGTFYDTGDKFEYLKTCIDAGLRNKETSKKLKEYIKNIAKRLD